MQMKMRYDSRFENILEKAHFFLKTMILGFENMCDEL